MRDKLNQKVNECSNRPTTTMRRLIRPWQH